MFYFVSVWSRGVWEHPMADAALHCSNAQDAIFNICCVIVTLTRKIKKKKMETRRICLQLITTGTHYVHRTKRLNDWIDLWHISFAFSSFFLVTLKINFNNRLKITIKSQDTRCIHSITSQFHQCKIPDFFPLEHFMNGTTHSSRQQSVVASINSEEQKERKIRAAHQSMVDQWLASSEPKTSFIDWILL